MQFWPPDDEHICSKHVDAWNKLVVKQKVCASNWLITEIKKTYHINLAHVEFESKSYTSNNRVTGTISKSFR